MHCQIYAKESGPHQVRAAEIYSELRHNVIENAHRVSLQSDLVRLLLELISLLSPLAALIYQEYVRTGYVWEQYDPETGEGKRSHPFNGWTSLAALIMAEMY